MTATIPEFQPLTAEQLEQVRDLYDRGLALSAYEAGRGAAPIALWRPLEAMLLAGRLAQHLGAPRLSDWLLRSAYRAAPGSAEARYYYGYGLWRRRGPYFTWKWMDRQPEPGDEATADTRASWLALRAGVAGMLRDFGTAEKWLARAREASPDNPWIKVCEAQQLEYLDRYDDALGAAREALAMRPWHRPAVQAAGHLLSLMGRDDEACQLFAEADQRLENAGVAGQLYTLQCELRRYDAAARTLERFAQLTPLIEKEGRQWLAGQRAELAYYRGDKAAAIVHARESESDYWKAIAERLEDPSRQNATRVLLPVDFVRQHHVTCVPATLTAISRYWSMPADHLQVADEICYNGTSGHSERKWAREHGWVTREFSITEESAAALLERGVPFTFTTIEPTSAHLQAVSGYDGCRGTIHIRDPYHRNTGEALADKLLERYQASGPRGMALVPQSEAARLADLDLPDAALWDELHSLDGALVEHRREAAQTVLDRLLQAAPDHRLTLEARRRVAIYDGNPAEHLAAVEALLKQFPDNARLQLDQLALSRNQADRDQRLARLAGLVAKKDCHPIFWQQYAQELRTDARRHDEATRLLTKALRRWPMEASNYVTLAHIYWDHRRLDEALELYRLAACLSDKDEQLVHTYFTAAVWCKATDEVLQMLHERFERHGRKSSQPAMTLADAYVQLDRDHYAIGVVEDAMRLRPTDGGLMLYAADLYAASGTQHLEKTKALLAAAEGQAPRTDWLRSKARLTHAEGDLTGALALWREVLEAQPLATDAHRAASALLAETEGRPAALAHVAAAVERFPHHYPLMQLWVEWLRDEPDDVREPALRQVIARYPDDAWLRRELGLLLSSRRRFAKAREQADLAGRLEPNSPSHLLLLASIYEGQDRIAEAVAALRQAVELSVDNDYAVSDLMRLCRTAAERREALAFLKQQLVKQVTFGDGLLHYRGYAKDTLPDEELLADLQEALQARPDLWHAWSAMARQLLGMNRLSEARSTIEHATERFPLLPRLWLERAMICRFCSDPAAELEALETAHRLNARWGASSRALAEALARRGDYARARELLEKAAALSPLDVPTQIELAQALWRDDEREAALDRIERAAQLDPGYGDAWNLLREWCGELKCRERAVAAARTLTQQRAGEARSWLTLARLLDQADETEERLAALDKAVELNPRSVDAHEQRVVALTRAGRYDEAHAAARPAVFGDYPPIELRGCGPWIEAERGNRAKAIEMMAAVLADEPSYDPGWAMMADWCRETQDHGRYLKAAESLVKLHPHYEVGYGYLGEARMLAGDRQGAREAYARAFELSPQYEFAGNALFDMQIEQGDWEGAAATVATLRAHSDSGYVLGREAQMAARRRDFTRLGEIIEHLAVTESSSPWPLEIAVQSLVEAGGHDEAREVLHRLVRTPQSIPQVGLEWMRVELQAGNQRAERQLREILPFNRPVAEQAADLHARSLCQPNNLSPLRRFARDHEDWLRQTDSGWGLIGSALAGARDYREVARWMADWRERPQAEPWMLVNLIEALHALGRRDEAVEVSQFALTRPPQPAQQMHHLWLATDAAGRGDVAAASEHLAHVDVPSLGPEWALLGACAQGVIDLDATAPDERPAVFAAVRKRIAEAKRNYAAFDMEPGHKRAWRECAGQIAARLGTTSAKLWYAWIWLRSRFRVA